MECGGNRVGEGDAALAVLEEQVREFGCGLK
jgi:hypothetical protein